MIKALSRINEVSESGVDRLYLLNRGAETKPPLTARRPDPSQQAKPTSASGSKPFFERKKNPLPRTRPTRAGDGDGGDGHLEAHAGGVRRRGRGGREGEERRRGRGAAAVLPAAHPRPAAPDPAEDPQPQPPRGPAQRPQLPR